MATSAARTNSTASKPSRTAWQFTNAPRVPRRLTVASGDRARGQANSVFGPRRRHKSEMSDYTLREKSPNHDAGIEKSAGRPTHICGAKSPSKLSGKRHSLRDSASVDDCD